MAETLPFHPLTTIARPVSPDFYLCHPFYGQHLSVPECVAAAGQLPTGDQMVEFGTDANGVYRPYDIPFVATSQGCQVRVSFSYIDAVGNLNNHGLHVIPDLVRNLAGWLIHSCVGNGLGIGGFGTIGIANMIAFLQDRATTRNLIGNGPWPAYSTFMTVTISGPGQGFKEDPAYFDPETAHVLSDAMQKAGKSGAAEALAAQSIWMTRGGEQGWWETFKTDSPSEGEGETETMLYSCDASLGSPTSVDCSLLSYSELGAPSDSVTIGPAPGASKTLSSKSCRVAITSAVTVTLTWAQIRAALDALIDSCVAEPFHAATGGVASTGPPHQVTVGVGHKRKRATTISGLNALPPGVKITISSN